MLVELGQLGVHKGNLVRERAQCGRAFGIFRWPGAARELKFRRGPITGNAGGPITGNAGGSRPAGVARQPA